MQNLNIPPTCTNQGQIIHPFISTDTGIGNLTDQLPNNFINQPKHNLSFPELGEAISKGYRDHFSVLANGLLQCMSNQDKHYEIDELQIKTITCSSNKATVYLIATIDGMYKGVLVDYWEY